MFDDQLATESVTLPTNINRSLPLHSSNNRASREAMQWWCYSITFIFIAIFNNNNISSVTASTAGKRHRFLLSTFVSQHHRHRPIAFIDTKKDKLALKQHNIAASRSMTTLKNNKEEEEDHTSDAKAYHEFVSSAVDFTNVYARNGVVTATRSVRDIDTNTRRQFLYNIPLPTKSSQDSNSNNDDDYNQQPPYNISPPVEIPKKIKARIPSPSGDKIAILVEEEESTNNGDGSNNNKRTVFEIWTNNGHCLSNRIVLSKEIHGTVCTDFNWFGGISWNYDESVLVYTAEVNKPKSSSYFSTTPSSGVSNNNAIGGQYTLGIGKSENWGEKYTTTSLLQLFCLNVNTGKIGLINNVPGGSSTTMMNNNDDDDGNNKTTASTTLGGYVLGAPIFSPCGKSVVYTGWDAGGGGEMPRRLGAIYCFQRPCKIYSSCVTDLLDKLASTTDATTNDDEGTKVLLKGEDVPFQCITPNDRLARSPRFSAPTTNGGSSSSSKLVYLCNTKGFDTHGGCMALHVCDWDMKNGCIVQDSQSVVVDIVQLPGERGQCDEVKISDIQFPGLFLNQLRNDCFSPDGRYIVTTTEWGCVNKVVAVSLEDGTVTPINFDLLNDKGYSDKACQQFWGFTKDGGAIVSQSEANRPTVLGYFQPTFLKKDLQQQQFVSSQVLADLPPVSSTAFTSLKSSSSGFKSYSYQIMTTQPEHGDVKVPVGMVLLLPDDRGNDEKLPLIVVPHGGPHTCMSTSYFPSYGYLCKHGRYAILHVNFRGSTGFGQAALESLAGNAGSLDVEDVVAATRVVIDAGIVDPDRVGICGGSHGGFLAGHCIGQHPELFKVAAMRNPCTNIASMVTATDIPDWCYVETLGTGHYNFSDFRTPTKEELDTMWDKSPIAHMKDVTAPTLVGLGMQDRRVPPSQGIEYYHALRAKGVPTKLLVYDDCDHAIDLVASEADFWINTKQWFDRHL